MDAHPPNMLTPPQPKKPRPSVPTGEKVATFVQQRLCIEPTLLNSKLLMIYKRLHVISLLDLPIHSVYCFVLMQTVLV